MTRGLSAGQTAEIKEKFGRAEFARFQQAVIELAQQHNAQTTEHERFDLRDVEGEGFGIVRFAEYAFEFRLDAGTRTQRKADIAYRFRIAGDEPSIAAGASAHGNGNGNGNGAHGAQERDTGKSQKEDDPLEIFDTSVPEDPRNTPLMRYEPDILGEGTELGQFEFYWDGETTDELAQSLMEEFVEWID